MSERPQHSFDFYETDKGLIVKQTGVYRGKYKIQDVEPEPTFHSEWFLIPGVLKFKGYTAHDGYDYINKHYERIEDGICTLPQCLKPEEVEKDSDGDWIGKYRGLQGQYRHVHDTVDRGFVKKECYIRYLGEFHLSNLNDPTTFSYSMHPESFSKDRIEVTVKSLWSQYNWTQYIDVNDITKAMVPEFAWHMHPVTMKSSVIYRIVRAFIKDNIDPKVAEITSDYDFCFTVKKRIAIKPYEYRYQVPKSARGRRRPQFSSKTVSYRAEQVFEMTHAGHKYQGYTVIDPFEGKNLKDLSENIDAYLAELISVINTPTVECAHCQGIGVLEIIKSSTNERTKNNVIE